MIFAYPLLKGFVNLFSIQFDGVDEFVDLGDIANFDRTDSFSISFWAKTSSASAQTNLARWDSSAAKGFLSFFNTGQVNVFFGGSSANRIRVKFTFNFSDGVYHHYIWTYNGNSTAAGWNLYIDGVLKTLAVDQDSLSTPTTNAKTMQIGVNDDSGSPYNGVMDEVSIYNKELSSSEVTDIFNLGIPRRISELGSGSNLITWLRFTQIDKDNFPIIADNSGNNNDGTAANMESSDIQGDTP